MSDDPFGDALRREFEASFVPHDADAAEALIAEIRSAGSRRWVAPLAVTPGGTFEMPTGSDAPLSPTDRGSASTAGPSAPIPATGSCAPQVLPACRDVSIAHPTNLPSESLTGSPTHDRDPGFHGRACVEVLLPSSSGTDPAGPSGSGTGSAEGATSETP